MNKTLEELKIDFILAVYDSLNKQIQQTDIKISLVLSWCSIIAVMLGRTLGQMVSGQFVNVLTIPLAALCLGFLGASGVFVFWTLKPRAKFSKRKDFVGLLYAGDVLRLGKSSSARIETYLSRLQGITEPDQIYEQFVSSIVLVSDISQRKNRSFMRALAFTAVSFCWLVILMGVMAIRTGSLQRAM